MVRQAELELVFRKPSVPIQPAHFQLKLMLPLGFGEPGVRLSEARVLRESAARSCKNEG